MRPGQRNPLMTRGGAGIIEFGREVRSELRKVIWPTRKELTNLTLVVSALAIALGVFLGSIDYLFQELFRLVLQAFGAGGL